MYSALAQFYEVHSPQRRAAASSITSHFLARGGGAEELQTLNRQLRGTYGADLGPFLHPDQETVLMRAQFDAQPDAAAPAPAPAPAPGPRAPRTPLPAPQFQSERGAASPTAWQPPLVPAGFAMPSPLLAPSAAPPRPAPEPAPTAQGAVSPGAYSTPGATPGGGEAVVAFNVGGQIFMTTASTVRNRGRGSLIHRLLTGEERPVAVDSAGRVFIDRDPALFEPILDFLRHGILPDPRAHTPQQLARAAAEAEAYGLSALSAALAAGRHTAEQQQPEGAAASSGAGAAAAQPESGWEPPSDAGGAARDAVQQMQARGAAAAPAHAPVQEPPREAPAAQWASGPVSSVAEEIKALSEALVKFYLARAPDEVAKVTQLVQDFARRGGGPEQLDVLNASLRSKFGACLPEYGQLFSAQQQQQQYASDPQPGHVQGMLPTGPPQAATQDPNGAPRGAISPTGQELQELQVAVSVRAARSLPKEIEGLALHCSVEVHPPGPISNCAVEGGRPSARTSTIIYTGKSEEGAAVVWNDRVTLPINVYVRPRPRSRPRPREQATEARPGGRCRPTRHW